MAKKHAKKKDSPSVRTSHVQFRPSRLLQGQVSYFSRKWNVSVNEAAKEICLLASAGLGIRHRELVRKLARVLGDPDDLDRACEWFHVALMQAKPSWDPQDLDREVDDEPASMISDLIREVEARNRDATKPA
jgi:hypothetical protein